MEKIKDSLKKKLSKKELNLIPSSFDVVGSILLFSEFPKQLEKKERIIAKAFLDELKNVKTICKKTRVYSGIYRTPKLKIIAGEKNKQTIHKENGILLKIDVEKVYFSTRSSNERLRIAKLIQPNEEILVMFSGSGVYPCVFAKNSEAKYIYGIEINPIAHKYALENMKLNNLSNVFFIKNDVKKSAKNFYQEILGLKSALRPKELPQRLKYDPQIIEVYTTPEDFEKNIKKLKKQIKRLLDQGKQVYVHQPALFNKSVGLDMANFSIVQPIYQSMINLLKEFPVDLIIHFNETESKNKDSIINNIRAFKKYYKNIFFEAGSKAYSSKIEDMIEIIEKTGIRNVCIDTCHLLHQYKPEELPLIIKKIQSKCNTYFHLSDYKDGYHAAKLDENSNIDLKSVLPFVTKGITEIRSHNELKGKEMIESWNYLKNFTKTFDRILMPLPKSAEDFLETALSLSKKGTIIHFYDFLNEKDFNLAEEKIAKACEKAKLNFKVLNLVKCGQFGPRIFRICLDFQII
jgi:tRNA G37 N-methylase Trm5